ncbi:MAG: hypothetical protein ACR2NB_12015 [Solirubrobacteraceae bacterium]
MPELDDSQITPREFDARIAEVRRAVLARESSRVSDRVLGLVATFVVAGSIGGIGLAVSASARKDIARAERAMCQRVVADRLGTIRLRDAQESAVRKIAQDPGLSVRDRDARLVEATALRLSTDDLRTRVEPKNGGSLDCAKEYPVPGVFG